MARPITPAQAHQNRDFLNVLRRTGNARLAAREAGVKYGTMQHRRRAHPAFATRWDSALVVAQARLARARLSGSMGLRLRGDDERGRGDDQRGGGHDERGRGADDRGHRTSGGEPTIVRNRDGTLQVRRAQPGKLTRAAEQAFLAALSATCNMSLSAAAVGANPHAFYRRRMRCPAFAREVRLALQTGYDRLEWALLEGGTAASHEHDEWRRNDPRAMPPITANQALQLMYLHQKEARLLAEPFPVRRRKGEPHHLWLERLARMAEERDRRAIEEFEVAEAERRAAGEAAWGPAGEEVRRRLGLPDLAQVSGWSRADPAKPAHDPQRALFGGWRIEDMERRLEEGEWGEEPKG